VKAVDLNLFWLQALNLQPGGSELETSRELLSIYFHHDINFLLVRWNCFQKYLNVKYILSKLQKIEIMYHPITQSPNHPITQSPNHQSPKNICLLVR